ncbi:sigma-70 family RNA polymerase sigma factor [Streptomyces sp. LP05-1]|uniref:RNA polymerase sigma factor n=1 Tax=Streptomyces pyxinae TaxID=2970734 RepID=A0ABT2CCE7_9ACTN|nr:sigma-70 family RNA polymerase sigma factor [Streptomyces sp. LP05-1]MCS0635088.1 sigma-70 family RNA polymerase sigma factor [Streptomyces sp. LP05-1]
MSDEREVREAHEAGESLVRAAQGGDQRAQDALVAAYLPLVYNIVGRALGGHADVDDVVQDTMIRALGGLGSLRDPARFRSWLVAITMNQIRDHRFAPAALAALSEGHEVADPGADFVDLTIVRLGLSGQRREVAEATRWLDDTDRALLSLWWLEAAGELTRTEVAAAMELSPQHTAVRVQRMKAQLETARIVVRALTAVPRCVLLDDALVGWDGLPSALWRKRIARHARECTACSGHGAGLVPAEGLLVGLGLVPVGAALAGAAGLAGGAGDALGLTGATQQIPGAGYAGTVPGAGHPGPLPGAGRQDPGAGTWSGGDATAQLPAVGSGGHGPGGLPGGGRGSGGGRRGNVSDGSGGRTGGRGRARQDRRRHQRRTAVVAAAVALLVVGGGIAGVKLLGPDGATEVRTDTAAEPARSQVPWDAPVTPAVTPSASASPSASPSPSASKSPSASATPSAKPKPKPTPGRTRTERPEPSEPRPRPEPEPEKSEKPDPAPAGGSFGQRVTALVNSERAKNGCGPVSQNGLLDTAARRHSDDMAARGYFDHTSPDGKDPGDRVTAAGYQWSTYGENIARGQQSPESVMDSWMNSSGHRANILNCSFKEIGVGIHEGSGGPWWTQVFGARS